MTTRTCETCRAVEALIRGAGTTQGLAHATLALASPPPSDLADLEARVRSLVAVKRAYEQSLPTDDPDTVEHEHKRGIVVGLQMAIDRIKKETGILVDDPAPSKTRRRKGGDGGGSNGAIARRATEAATAAGTEPRASISPPPSPYALSLLAVIARRHPSPSTDEQIAVLAGRSRRSSTFTEAMGALREDGLVEGPTSARVATLHGLDEALRLIGVRRDLMSRGPELLALWKGKLERSEAKILDAIVDLTRAHPRIEDRDPARVRVGDVSRESGYSETSSSFTAAIGKLRRLGLVDKSNRCAEELIR